MNENTKAESFYSFKYGSSNNPLNIRSNDLFCFMSFQVFFKQYAILAFLYYFGFNLKKNTCRKSQYLQSTVEYLTEYLTFHI